MVLLRCGTLWKSIVKKTGEALASGALQPVPTEHEFVEDGGIRFFVRVLSALARKDEEKRKRELQSAQGGGKVNPFLPYDEELFVSDISDTHLALLNKFNVVEHHLLIVTRQFEDQKTLLTLQDFEALSACLAEFNGLGFYNGGVTAGASQPHKHLQMVPLPLGPTGPEVPIGLLLDAAGSWKKPGTVPGLPFVNAFVRFGRESTKDLPGKADIMFHLYGALLRKVSMTPPRTSGLTLQSGPYCLLITRSWMLLVPRSQEFFDSVSINSLGFAGALLVRNRVQLEDLKKFGPMNALRSVAVPLQKKTL